jgi:very-short-patch-repair endonuclease
MREEIAPADPAELEIASIAARQHGVVAVGQLYAAGVEKSAISRRVRAGRFHRLHRGVYAVGHPGVSEEGRWMAAVLACGDGAALSHLSAAALWELLPARQGRVDISTPSRAGRARQEGIRLHRCRSLERRAVTRRFGIPVTTPARTISDLRPTLPAWEWRRAVRQAEFSGLSLGSELQTDGTRSDLERDFLRICRRHSLPPPEVNVRLGHWTVDFLWRAERLVVETDGYRYHRGHIAFQEDRARDLDLRRLGFEVRRFSERQIGEEPSRVAEDLADAFVAS